MQNLPAFVFKESCGKNLLTSNIQTVVPFPVELLLERRSLTRNEKLSTVDNDNFQHLFNVVLMIIKNNYRFCNLRQIFLSKK